MTWLADFKGPPSTLQRGLPESDGNAPRALKICVADAMCIQVPGILCDDLHNEVFWSTTSFEHYTALDLSNCVLETLSKMCPSATCQVNMRL